MKSRRFKLVEKDIPFLKKDTRINIILIIMFAITLIWQSLSFILSFVNNSYSILKLCVLILVVVTSIMFICTLAAWAVRNQKLISVIKERGHCLWDVPFIASTSKSGFYSIFKIVALIFACLFCGIIVTNLVCLFVQNSYMSKSTLDYLPLLFMFATSALNAYFYIKSNAYFQKLNYEQNIY